MYRRHTRNTRCTYERYLKIYIVLFAPMDYCVTGRRRQNCNLTLQQYVLDTTRTYVIVTQHGYALILPIRHAVLVIIFEIKYILFCLQFHLLPL